jgi:hypothetical protein
MWTSPLFAYRVSGIMGTGPTGSGYR